MLSVSATAALLPNDSFYDNSIDDIHPAHVGVDLASLKTTTEQLISMVNAGRERPAEETGQSIWSTECSLAERTKMLLAASRETATCF